MLLLLFGVVGIAVAAIWTLAVMRYRVLGIAKENTERKRAQEALRKQQEFLAVLLENVTDGIVACNAQGIITHFNRATREWHGLAAEPIPAERWAEYFDLYLPDGQTRMEREQVPLFRALQEGAVRNAEMVIAPGNGPARRVLSTGQALYDDAGVKTGAVVVMRDVTEERRSEEAIRMQATMLDSIGQAVIATDLAGRITYTNRFAQHLYGWTSAEMNGRSILDVTVSQATRSEARQIMAQLERGESWRGEFLVRRRDGGDFLAAVTNTGLRDRCGALVGIVGISEDISERKQAEKALRQQHAMLSNAQRVAGMGLWELDVLSNHLVWSQETHRIFGVAVEDFGNCMESFLALVHPDDVQWMTELYARPVSSTSAVDLEYRIRRPDGEERVLLERGEATSDATGRLLRKSGVVMDITERRSEQNALRTLNAQLEARVLARTAELNQSRILADQANQAKSSFLATMSHEIRTPMNGVIGMLDVLQQTHLEVDQVEMVDLIRDSAGSLLDIIEDVLDFSKIEAGRMEIAQESFQLAVLLEKVRGMLDRWADKHRVRLKVVVDPTIPQALLGDETRLRQLLVNLVGNAIKFSGSMERAGEVTVRALRARHAAEGVMIDLTVADNGIGMEKGTLARLFTPFEQADASTTRRFGGSGLGLAISAMLVRLMGGTLSASSEPGRGSTFTARLVFAEPHSISGAEGSRPAGEPGITAPCRSSPDKLVGNSGTPPGALVGGSPGRLILVAEDNETNRAVIARQLTLIGLAFQIAVNGREALERWRSGDFALLLTDLHMPEMDGYALATAIRAEEHGKARTPIIALTANALRDEELRCLAAGMDAYLTKPIRLTQLKAAIERELDTPGAASEAAPAEAR